MFEYDSIDSPIGKIIVAAHQGKLVSLDFLDYEARFEELLKRRFGADAEASPVKDPIGMTTRLKRYFDRDFSAFDGIPLETRGTPFQQRVWQSLKEIPPGETWTYAQLANFVESPKGFRAVGMANSQNPIGIVLPCHRVIGSNKTLTGYAGGLHRKKWLLEHESTGTSRLF